MIGGVRSLLCRNGDRDLKFPASEMPVVSVKPPFWFAILDKETIVVQMKVYGNKEE